MAEKVSAGPEVIDLFIDLQGAQTDGSRRRGIGRYTRDLVRALARHEEKTELHLGWNTSLTSPLQDLTDLTSGNGDVVMSSPYSSLKRSEFPRGAHDVEHEINDVLLRQAIARSRCRHILFSSVMEMDAETFVLPKNLNYGPDVTSYAILYDIIPYLYKEHYLHSPPLENTWRRHLHVQLSADILFAISERTRQDAIRHLGVDPARIVTIGTGIDLKMFQGAQTDADVFRQRHKLTQPFLFFLGGDEYRKNLKGFVAAVSQLAPTRRDGLQFLIAGSVNRELQNTIRDEAGRAGVSENQFVFAGLMSEEDLRCAYSACVLTVIPSLSEGFGLPVLEAMAHDCPIIASANTSMAEIIDDERLLCDAANPADIAARIEFALEHPELTEAIKRTYPDILRRYDWNHVAKRVIEALKARPTLPAPRVRGPARPLHIRIHGAPGDDWIRLIEAIGQRHIVTLHCSEAIYKTLQTLPVAVHHHSALSSTPGEFPLFIMICDNAYIGEAVAQGGLSEAVVLMRQWPHEDIRSFFLLYVDDGARVVRYAVSTSGIDREEVLHYGHTDQLASILLDRLDVFADFSTHRLAERLKRVLHYYRSGAADAATEAAAVNVFDTRRL